MITIILFILSWIIFLIFGDKKRIPEIFPTCIFSAFLALLTDLIMERYQLWSYQEIPLNRYWIPILLDFSIYPVITYFFMQYLPNKVLSQILYIFLWTLGAIFLEYIYFSLGIIVYKKWWEMWNSYISDWVLFILFILQYKYYSRMKVKM